MSSLRAMEVNRDDDGYWCHPDLVHFWTVTMNEAESCTPEQWQALEQEAGITTTFAMLESEPIDHPAYIAYFDNGDADISAWEPAVPNGYWILSISCTEDGPYAIFATEAAWNSMTTHST